MLVTPEMSSQWGTDFFQVTVSYKPPNILLGIRLTIWSEESYPQYEVLTNNRIKPMIYSHNLRILTICLEKKSKPKPRLISWCHNFQTDNTFESCSTQIQPKAPWQDDGTHVHMKTNLSTTNKFKIFTHKNPDTAVFCVEKQFFFFMQVYAI